MDKQEQKRLKDNAKIQKAIDKKNKNALEWRKDAQRARNKGDLRLGDILEGKAKEAETEALNLKGKMK